MSVACLPARTATIALRRRGREPRIVTVAFPAKWRRSTLLAYARRAHSPQGETVRILTWHPLVDELGEPLWLANHEAFTDYRQGVMA